MIYAHDYQSPLGPIVLTSDGENITGLWFYGQRHFGGAQGRSSGAGVMCARSGGKFPFGPGEKGVASAQTDDGTVGGGVLPIFTRATKWLDNYFAGKNPSVSDLPLAPAGTDFQKTVWRILTEIPHGDVVTYGDIAKGIATHMDRKTTSPRAVGGAVGRNPISIMIPCHRVVGVNASLTGYAGGLDRKIKLLEIENIDLSKFTIPTKGTAI